MVLKKRPTQFRLRDRSEFEERWRVRREPRVDLRRDSSRIRKSIGRLAALRLAGVTVINPPRTVVQINSDAADPFPDGPMSFSLRH